jgi:hypothetical protein
MRNLREKRREWCFKVSVISTQPFKNLALERENQFCNPTE